MGGVVQGLVVGVVLTGGASRRMGRTKALVEVDGVAMAIRVANALTDAGCEPVVLLGGDPIELQPLGMAVLADAHPGEGPLGGILTALEHFAGPVGGGTDVVVVACDLPGLTGAVIRSLVGADATADVVVAHTTAIEPGCALWRSTAREPLRALFDDGVRAVHQAIATLRSVEVQVPASAMHNINVADDLDRYS